MLKELVEKKRTLFLEGVETWQDAVRQSLLPLERDGTVDETYAQEVIDCVTTHGPYIVLIPGYAIPHSTENSKGAHGTGICFMKLAQPVSFDPNDPEKDASVFFPIASTDPENHLKNMKTLFKMLTDEDLVEDLLHVTCDDDLLALSAKYGL